MAAALWSRAAMDRSRLQVGTILPYPTRRATRSAGDLPGFKDEGNGRHCRPRGLYIAGSRAGQLPGDVPVQRDDRSCRPDDAGPGRLAAMAISSFGTGLRRTWCSSSIGAANPYSMPVDSTPRRAAFALEAPRAVARE